MAENTTRVTVPSMGDWAQETRRINIRRFRMMRTKLRRNLEIYWIKKEAVQRG